MLRSLIKKITPIRRAYIKAKMDRSGIGGQSDEGDIIFRLSRELSAPKTFIEFGFHVNQFNCAPLIKDHDGLLIDGDKNQVADARHFLPKNIRVENAFLTLDNIKFIKDAFSSVGVLSIDVDGNDYWFMEALLDTNPSIIVVEYNASFGHESVTVPYDPAFDRNEKHPTGWYHGASLTALHKLAKSKGYGLAAISEGGGNAFFTKLGVLDPVKEWKPCRLRDDSAGFTWKEQWEQIKDMPLVQI